MPKFKDILANTSGNLKILPVLHSCDVYGFRSILETKTLELNPCEVFNENLLYGFYGIPSYRKKLDQATKNLAFFPVCFILNCEELPEIYKLHPFDTGAFTHLPKIKEDHFHTKMELKDFELDKEITQASKVVEKFYSNNYKYLRNEPCLEVSDFQGSEFEAKSYASLISDTSNSNYDNRVSTIELIFNQEIKLNNKSLIQVIFPTDLLDDFKELLEKEFNIIKPLSYYTIKSNPIENFGTIYNKFVEYAIENELI